MRTTVVTAKMTALEKFMRGRPHRRRRNDRSGDGASPGVLMPVFSPQIWAIVLKLMGDTDRLTARLSLEGNDWYAGLPCSSRRGLRSRKRGRGGMARFFRRGRRVYSSDDDRLSSEKMSFLSSILCTNACGGVWFVVNVERPAADVGSS
jgi:hypothetical protein